MPYNTMMQNLALLLSGFSIFYSLVLILIHFNQENKEFRTNTHLMGVVLLLALMVLQFFHFLSIQNESDWYWIHSKIYLICLFMVAPAFYFYARPLLKAENSFGKLQWLHFVPVFSVFFVNYEMAFSAAFILGSCYLLWLAKTIYALKSHREKFKSEIVLLAFVFVVALIVSVLALTQVIEKELFFSLYASAVGLAILLVAVVIGLTPKITESVTQAARETYAVSTLVSVDCQSKLIELDNFMQKDRLYKQNNLDLHTMAAELELSSHQLSELINTKLGMSFSRFLREHRINAAKNLLINQPKASVLSIGMEVGFSSQSNFYEAFKNMTNTTPAKYRKTLRNERQRIE